MQRYCVLPCTSLNTRYWPSLDHAGPSAQRKPVADAMDRGDAEQVSLERRIDHDDVGIGVDFRWRAMAPLAGRVGDDAGRRAAVGALACCARASARYAVAARPGSGANKCHDVTFRAASEADRTAAALFPPKAEAKARNSVACARSRRLDKGSSDKGRGDLRTMTLGIFPAQIETRKFVRIWFEIQLPRDTRRSWCG